MDSHEILGKEELIYLVNNLFTILKLERWHEHQENMQWGQDLNRPAVKRLMTISTISSKSIRRKSDGLRQLNPYNIIVISFPIQYMR